MSKSPASTPRPTDFGVELLHGDANRRMLAEEDVDAGRQQADVERVGHADPQAAAQLLGRAAQAAQPVVDLGQRHFTLPSSCSPASVIDDALADAVEQPMADLGFELLDLVRQRRLGDVDGFGRTGEVELLGERREITQMTQFHGRLHTAAVLGRQRPSIDAIDWFDGKVSFFMEKCPGHKVAVGLSRHRAVAATGKSAPFNSFLEQASAGRRFPDGRDRAWERKDRREGTFR